MRRKTQSELDDLRAQAETGADHEVRALVHASKCAGDPTIALGVSVISENSTKLFWKVAQRTFLCVVCQGGSAEPWIAVDSRGVPHDHPTHEFTYEWTVIAWCPACMHATVTVFDHDCYPSDDGLPHDMVWTYVLRPLDVGRVMAFFQGCNSLSDPDCQCTSHGILRKEIERLRQKPPFNSNTCGRLRIEYTPSSEFSIGCIELFDPKSDLCGNWWDKDDRA